MNSIIYYMKIFIFACFLFIFSYYMEAMERKILNLNEDSVNTDNTEIEKEKNYIEVYLPNYQDYRFWTEENNLKKTLLNIESFSIEKYYSHNFFKHDDFGFFYNQGNEKNLLIPNRRIPQKNLFHSQNILFFKDPFFSREKIQYFDVQTPLSEIFYENNLFQERGLGGFFSQSPNEKINYSIEYRTLNLKKKLDFEKNQNLLITTLSYQDQDDYYYKLWGHYILQKFYLKEREEVIKWIKNYNYKNVFFDQKKFTHNRFYISFIQKIFHEKNKLFFFKTYMEYEKYSKSHFFSEQKNKINHFDLKNGFSLMFKKNKFEIEVGSIFDKIHYQLFLLNEYNNRIIPKNKYINNMSIETQINYPINNILKFHSHSKWTMEYNNLKKTYFQMNMKFNTFLFSKFDFSSQLYISENKGVNPDYIHLYILRENEDCYNNQRSNMLSFDKEKTIDFSLFYNKNFHFSFYISRLDHSFLDEKKEMEKFLYRKDVQSYGLKIKTTQDVWKFQFHNLFMYQKYNSDPLVFSIPNFLSRSTISYQDNYFNKSLSIKTGFSVHYFSHFYYQKIYYPFDIYLFPSEKECYPNKIGGNPFMDYFLNLKIYRTIFYLSIQNIGFHSIYSPFNKKELFIRTGFSWTLFT
ncbi:putative porin [Blattabacterium cuenoti]|uniref:putative porin n=1 Tax=Blattabacterium cuenoti TaxID=1653831 RepID=UPI001EEBA1A1|nr:putative porin [Blattabacterium cuenoti]